MQKGRRILVATLSGVFFGLVCYWLAASSTGGLPTPVAFQIVASRTLIGFAIGISCINLVHWSVHGLAMGLVFSIPLAFSGLMAPESPEFSKTGIFVFTIILGMIYGLMTEAITSLIFKARQQV